MVSDFGCGARALSLRTLTVQMMSRTIIVNINFISMTMHGGWDMWAHWKLERVTVIKQPRRQNFILKIAGSNSSYPFQRLYLAALS